MKDNRIFRTEQLTQKQAEGLNAGANAYFEKMAQKDAEREAEHQRKIDSGEYIVVDGKCYDARFYKGGKA